MPPKELPIEQTFAQKFTACGGKFVYCESLQDAKDAFLSIVREYPSEIRELFCLDPVLAKKIRRWYYPNQNQSQCQNHAV